MTNKQLGDNFGTTMWSLVDNIQSVILLCKQPIYGFVLPIFTFFRHLSLAWPANFTASDFSLVTPVTSLLLMRMRRTRLSSVILVLVFIRTMIYICPSDDYDDLQRDWYYVSWPGFNAYQSQEAIRLIGEGVGGLVIIYFYIITREIGSCSTKKNGFKYCSY